MFFDFFLLDFSFSESLSPLPLSLSLSEINFFFCLLLSCLTFVFDSVLFFYFSLSESLSPLLLSPFLVSLSLSEVNFFFCLFLSCLTFVFDSILFFDFFLLDFSSSESLSPSAKEKVNLIKKNLKERNQETGLSQRQRLKMKGRDRKGNWLQIVKVAEEKVKVANEKVILIKKKLKTLLDQKQRLNKKGRDRKWKVSLVLRMKLKCMYYNLSNSHSHLYKLKASFKKNASFHIPCIQLNIYYIKSDL
jgi:hypothetical protein